jgi:hypothetical protein
MMIVLTTQKEKYYHVLLYIWLRLVLPIIGSSKSNFNITSWD